MNIVLLDRDGNLLEFILKHRNDNIVILVCEKGKKVTELLETYANSGRIHHIVDYDKLLDIQSVESIDYSLIEKMKPMQIDIETMLHRIMLNNPLAKDIYHQHLSYFSQIFQANHIDFLLCSEPNLCTPNHHIPLGLSKLANIPSYFLVTYHSQVLALLYHGKQTKQFLSFTAATIKAKVKDILFYKPQTKSTKTPTNLAKKIRLTLSQTMGEIFTQFLVCIAKKNFMQDRLGIPYSYWTKLYYFLKYKQLKRFYDKHATKPNLQEKYIYYSIHVEPEAAIIGTTLLESQLTVIKMLSHALPSGWKLYVKEHPHQFILNNEISHYFINNLDFFKNISLYQEIKKLHNVSLVSLDISSKELLQNAQAIATFGGTITLESAHYNIPAILFNPLESVYARLYNTLHVQSYQDLQKALEKLQNNFLKNKESNLEYIKDYLANPQAPNFHTNLFSTIETHSKAITPTGAQL